MIPNEQIKQKGLNNLTKGKNLKIPNRKSPDNYTGEQTEKPSSYRAITEEEIQNTYKNPEDKKDN